MAHGGGMATVLEWGHGGSPASVPLAPACLHGRPPEPTLPAPVQQEILEGRRPPTPRCV